MRGREGAAPCDPVCRSGRQEEGQAAVSEADK